MKDKLEKTGHKKHYYRLKTAVIALLFSLALGGVMAIPVGISYKISEAAAKQATSSSYHDDSEGDKEDTSVPDFVVEEN